MSSLKTKWGKRMAVVMAFALTVASIPGADAQAAKKAKLAKTKLTIKVGKKKTIKIKNKAKKAKYTFKSKKASIAKVSKKGVVTARKVGSTTITVKEKLGKKTRTLGKVRVTVNGSTAKKPTTTTPVTPTTPAPPAASDAGQGGVTNPTDVPVVTDAPTVPTEQATRTQRPVTEKPPTPVPTVKPTPSADPYTPKGKGWQKLDLSQWQGGSSENYLETGGQIVLSKVGSVSVPIPTSIDNIGDKIEVLIRGSVPTGSQGFRYWLTNAGNATMTTMGHYSNFGEGVEDPRKKEELDEEGNEGNPQEDLDPKAFKAGDFQVQRVLEHINKDKADDIIATKLLLKAPTYDGTLDGITITGIWVRYGDDIGNEDDPITPPGNESSSVESPDITKPENKSCAVDFEKDKIIYTTGTGALTTKEVADGIATFTMPQYTGFVFVLPEDKDSDAYKYVTITYQSTDGMLVEMFDENTNLSEPDTARDSATKHAIVGDDKFPASEEWKTVTYAVTDEFHNTNALGNNSGAYDFSKGSFKGIQIFNMSEGDPQTLKIKSIVFSEKELGSEEPGGEEPGGEEEDPEAGWTAVPLTNYFTPSKTASNVKQDASGSVSIEDAELVAFALPNAIPKDQKVKVRVKGSVAADSTGFRIYLLSATNADMGPNSQEHPENIYMGMKTDGADFEAGSDFDITAEIALDTGDALAVCIKGPSYGKNIAGVTINEISIQPVAE